METTQPDQLPTALRTLLTIVSMDALRGRAPIPGLPGMWSPRPDGVPGARVELAPAERLLVDGVPTGGVVDIDSSGQSLEPSPTVALDATHGIVVITLADAVSGDMIWVGATSEAAPRLRTFRGVSAYPYDDRWRIPVSFSPAGENERVSSVQMWRHDDPRHDMERAGWYAATIDGRQYRFSVDRTTDYAYVNFRDAGSGTESTEAGRVIRILGDPAGLDALDFNQAMVAPCALNPLMNCQLPPASNVIGTVVRAGQQDVLFDKPA
ncbi:DUF1684 domain-containing protein [Actinoplanes sp. NPDC049265]|uniref:DUF1684 domain-containing protein n=1 Tax=Actinoplanes sp. NPDC049265 TaxID=3363902 RepID=UPI0037141B4E